MTASPLVLPNLGTDLQPVGPSAAETLGLLGMNINGLTVMLPEGHSEPVTKWCGRVPDRHWPLIDDRGTFIGHLCLFDDGARTFQVHVFGLDHRGAERWAYLPGRTLERVVETLGLLDRDYVVVSVGGPSIPMLECLLGREVLV